MEGDLQPEQGKWRWKVQGLEVVEADGQRLRRVICVVSRAAESPCQRGQLPDMAGGQNLGDQLAVLPSFMGETGEHLPCALPIEFIFIILMTGEATRNIE